MQNNGDNSAAETGTSADIDANSSQSRIAGVEFDFREGMDANSLTFNPLQKTSKRNGYQGFILSGWPTRLKLLYCTKNSWHVHSCSRREGSSKSIVQVK